MVISLDQDGIKKRRDERSDIFPVLSSVYKSVTFLALNYFTGHSKDYFSNHKISNYAHKDTLPQFVKINYSLT